MCCFNTFWQQFLYNIFSQAKVFPVSKWTLGQLGLSNFLCSEPAWLTLMVWSLLRGKGDHCRGVLRLSSVQGNQDKYQYQTFTRSFHIDYSQQFIVYLYNDFTWHHTTGHILHTKLRRSVVRVWSWMWRHRARFRDWIGWAFNRGSLAWCRTATTENTDWLIIICIV